VYSEDQKASDGNGQQIDVLDRKLEVTGNLTEAQKEKLLQIANKCPVHRSFENGIRVKTELKVN
jgi:putative redox protein